MSLDDWLNNCTHWPDCATDGGPAHYECAKAKIVTLTRERDEALADARRFVWWFDDVDNGAFIAEYLAEARGMWTLGQWRAAIDKAMRGEGSA